MRTIHIRESSTVPGHFFADYIRIDETGKAKMETVRGGLAQVLLRLETIVSGEVGA